MRNNYSPPKNTISSTISAPFANSTYVLKTILLLLLLAGWVGTQAQTRKAIILKNRLGYKAGDTVGLKGCFPSNGDMSAKYYVWDGQDWRKANVSLFQVIDSSTNYWDNVWFDYRSGEVAKKGWNEPLRQQLYKDSKTAVEHFEKENLLFEDDLLTDYLYELVHKICPSPLHKGYTTNFKAYVIKSIEPKSFSFDDGTIVISTARLMQLNNERELVRVLTDEVANIVLDHQYINLQRLIQARTGAAIFTALVGITSTAIAINNEARGKFTFTVDDAMALTATTAVLSDVALNDMGVKLTWQQLALTGNVTRRYLKDNDSLWKFNTPENYIRRIGNVFTYSAYQEFYKSNYNEALTLVNRSENAGIASQDDYLLKAKLYRLLYATEESCFEALRYLQLAIEAAPTRNVDIFKEEGLIYLRLKDNDKALTALEEYRTGLQELGKNGEDNEKEIRWVNNTILRMAK
jgi:hypothetical protein